MIRVGLDAKRAYCNYRGLGNYSRLLVEGLLRWAKDDVQLSLLTPKITMPEFNQWPNNETQPVLPKGLNRFFPELWRGFLQTHEWAGLSLDLYHGLSHDLPWNVPGQSGRTKTLVTIHDLIFLRHPELYPALDRWTYEKKVRHSCSVANSVLAISEQTKKDLVELLEVPDAKIKVLYQAVHPRFYPENQNSSSSAPIKEHPYFLFVGAFEDRKNILRLLKAFAKVQGQTGHHLVLIGKGGLQQQIHEIVKAEGLKDRVHVKSQVSAEELPLYYRYAAAVTYPSLFEGFGLPIVEALMSETLIMTSHGGCFPESGGPGAFYVNPLSEDDIARTLLEIVALTTEAKAERLRLGREHSQQFHWRAVTEQLQKHYQWVLGQ